MSKLLEVAKLEDIPEAYRNTPIGLLLEYHNLGRKFDLYQNAGLLVGMCMDNRKHLIIPDNFAYIIRSGGANLRYSEFKVSYAIAVGGVSHIALIGHNNCGMVNLVSRKHSFVNGLVEKAGWDIERAADYFDLHASLFEIENEVDFISKETLRLRLNFPKITIAPMIYQVETNKLFLVKE